MQLFQGQQDLGDVVPRLEVDFNVADRDLSKAGLGVFGVAHDEFSIRMGSSDPCRYYANKINALHLLKQGSANRNCQNSIPMH